MPEDCVGVTEYVWMEYEDTSKFGSFKTRGSMSWDEFLDIGRQYLGGNDQTENPEDLNATSEPEIPAPLPDEDDEFDDFYDDYDD